VPMYSVARTLHGVRCSQCMYRWSVKSMLRVGWSISRVVCLDEENFKAPLAEDRHILLLCTRDQCKL
jgi:hypothetical protein